MQISSTGKYQKKFWVTVLISVILIFIAYKGAFVKTLSIYQQVRNLTKSINSSAQISSKKKDLQIEIEHINSLLGIHENKLPTDDIFKELTTICQEYDDAKIVNVPDIHQTIANSYKITTMFAELEGGFSSLLKIVWILEQNKKIGRLVSVNFKKGIDYKQKKEFLSLTILLQNYELIGPK